MNIVALQVINKTIFTKQRLNVACGKKTVAVYPHAEEDPVRGAITI